MPPNYSLNSLDPNNPDFDLEEWAQSQWDNWPDLETDLTFGYAVDGNLGEFDTCTAYFSYWIFKIDMRLDPHHIEWYPVELSVKLEGEP